MQIVGKLAKLGGFGLLGTLLAPKAKQVTGPRPVTTDGDSVAQMADDAIRRRKGSAADMLNGTRGAEAAAGSIGKAVIGN